MGFVPSIHDIEVNVNAENCCNGCCFPFRKKNSKKKSASKTDEKIQTIVKKEKKHGHQ